MRRNVPVALATALVLVLAIGVAGCDDAEKELDKAKKDVGEFAIRNAAALAGSAAFKENGHPLEKRLTCTADVTSANQATLACTGTTEDGRPATLDGTAEGDNLDKGTFVGKVDGQEVFTEDALTDNN